MGLKPHRPSDYPSFLLYILDEASITHLTVTVLTASYILYTRAAHSAYFALGALGSSLTAKFIKGFIKSPRPPPPPPPSGAQDARSTHIRPKKTYGMPSTHSTALTFYFAYLVPALLAPTLRFAASHIAIAAPSALSGPSSLSHPTVAHAVSLSQPARYLAAAAITAYWIGGVWSRIELGYHTYGQCFGGVGLGIAMAAVWRAGWDSNPWLGVGLQGLIDRIWMLVFH